MQADIDTHSAAITASYESLPQEGDRAFVHLHLHSQYSLLEGAIRLDVLMPHLRAQGMHAVALTDHGNMFGAVHFFKAAQKHGIKPIFGAGLHIGEPEPLASHGRDLGQINLLAQTAAGYQHLSYLVSLGYLRTTSGKPRVSLDDVAAHQEGIVGLSGSTDGMVGRALFAHGLKAAMAAAKACADAFRPGQFFLELCDGDHPDQDRLNEAMQTIARELHLPLVVTADARYLSADDANAHEVLSCIRQQRSLGEARQRGTHHPRSWFVRTPEQMWERFGALHAEALRNTVVIANSCNVALDLSRTFLPNYEVPEGETRESYLTRVARYGLSRRLQEALYDTCRDTYDKRLTYELDVINKMGFAGYFLVVWDFIRHAKEANIPVGPGRGSGAGSLVAFCLRITDLDPLPYDLLFERFLNPERVSMPDFDIDFCQDRRGEVIQYVAEKYGRDNVGQIVTYSLLSAKSVIKDVGRVMDLPFAEVNELTKLIPNLVNGKKVTIDHALTLEPKLRQIQEEKPVYGEVIEIARKLEGLGRQTGMHAAGIVIGDKPLWNYVPVLRGREGELITQFAKDEVEEAGLVKFDFLGLKTLTVIAKAQALVRARAGEGPLGSYDSFDASRIALNDPKVFKLIAKGDTDGVFQLESSGFKELLKRLKPDRFEDVVAAVALYRPGPLDAGMVDDYIARKHGRKKVTYPHEVCAQILKTTYGVIVYQEQVMRIAVALSGFSMGEADILRKAMGKKKADVMAQMREKFVAGAHSHSQMNPTEAKELFDQIEKFAGYAFNKSHSAAYAVISYQTAFLKTYFPVEFMAALLSTEMRDQDTVVRYIQSAKEHGIKIRPPCVNRSLRDFTVDDDETALDKRAILFGLGAVKGIGDSAIDAIVEARDAATRSQSKTLFFSDPFDFCEQVDLRRVNKRAMEALCKSGAWDSFQNPRLSMFDSIERALDAGQRVWRDKKMGQASLFGNVPISRPPPSTRQIAKGHPEHVEWPEKERLRAEKEALGFYITGHPLDAYAQELGKIANATTHSLRQQEKQGGAFRGREELRIAGVISAIKERPLKSGNGRMAFLQLEDRVGSMEVLVFSKAFAESEQALRSNEPLLFTGFAMMDGDEDSGQSAIKLRATRIEPLSDVRAQRASAVQLHGDVASFHESVVTALKDTLKKHTGSLPVFLRLDSAEGFTVSLEIGDDFFINPTEICIAELSAISPALQISVLTDKAASSAASGSAKALAS